MRQINDEIRAAQAHPMEDGLGGLSRTRWLRFFPGFLLRSLIRAASRSISMNCRFGVVGVTSVGMFVSETLWFVPLSGATITVTMGGIVAKSSERNVVPDTREHLCFTVSFNHDIVDGAQATRFLKRLSDLLLQPGLVRTRWDRCLTSVRRYERTSTLKERADREATRLLLRETSRRMRTWLERALACIDQLTDEQLWYRPNPSSNAIGNLVLHLVGNLRQWILGGIGDVPDTRDGRPSSPRHRARQSPSSAAC